MDFKYLAASALNLVFKLKYFPFYETKHLIWRSKQFFHPFRNLL